MNAPATTGEPPTPFWGVWKLPQSDLPVLPDDVAGLDAVELGCVSAWLARRGAGPSAWTQLMLCMPDVGPATGRLVRDLFGLHRLTWPDEPGVEFYLPGPHRGADAGGRHR